MRQDLHYFERPSPESGTLEKTATHPLDALLKSGVSIANEDGRLLQKGGVFGSRRSQVAVEWTKRWRVGVRGGCESSLYILSFLSSTGLTSPSISSFVPHSVFRSTQPQARSPLPLFGPLPSTPPSDTSCLLLSLACSKSLSTAILLTLAPSFNPHDSLSF